MFRTFFIGCAVLSLAAAGCATTGRMSYEAMQTDLQRDERRAADAGAGEGALPGPVLTRDALVRAVLDRNPSVAGARQAWRAALARYPQAGRYDDPRVSFALAPLSVGSDVRVGLQVGISQRFPFPGKIGMQKAAAEAEAEAAKEDYQAVRLQLALMTSLLFDDYYVVTRSLQVNAHHQALLGDLKTSALAAYQAGRGSAQDALQAEVEQVRLQREALTLSSSRDVTVAQMDELLHRDPTAPLPPPPQALPPPRVAGRSVAELAGTALRDRPDLAAARAHARAAQARADVAREEYWPDLEVTTAYNTMVVLSEHRWTVGVGLNVPLQLGRRGAAVEEADASRRRYEDQIVSLTDRARTDVAVALRRLREAREVVDLYEKRLVPVARDEVSAARAGFVASQNGFVAVMDAEKGLRQAELELEMARADLDRRAAELDRTLGHVPGGEEGAGR